MNPGMKLLMISNRENQRGDRDGQRNAQNRYESPSRMGGYNRGEYFPSNGGYGEERGDNPSMNYVPRMGGYEPEMRRNRAREGGYESESRGEQMRMGGYEIEGEGEEMRMGYDMPEGRRYKNGRFAPIRGGIQMHYGEHLLPERMQIGFAGSENDVMPLSQVTAEKWAQEMKNDDGTKGPHWNIEQIKMVMNQKGIEGDPWEFYAAMNAIYSDYNKVLKKHGAGDKLDVYIDMAKAFIEDKDAQPNKLARYYKYIVKH